MNVLIACEESQRVCAAFRDRGHNAFSCDIVECSGGHPEWHILMDCQLLLNGNCMFVTQDGFVHKIVGTWDLIIAHPPCTYLTVTGNRWFNTEKYGEKAKLRIEKRKEAIRFFMNFVYCDCEKVVIENPVGVMSTVYKKPTQIIQPYMFGDPYEKKTCLWLKGVDCLCPDNIVVPEKRKIFESGCSMPAWYAESWNLPRKERAAVRSKTFPGIARAMAEQWG